MKKILSFLLMLTCIGTCATAAVTENGYIGIANQINEMEANTEADDNDNGGPGYHIGASQNHLDDMIAIYYGSKSRLKWDKRQLEKVVTHTFEDGHTEWFFPTFLYLEFKNDSGVKFGDNQPGDKGPAKKEHWEWLLKRYFSTDKNGGYYEGLKALDECIEDCKKVLGEPHFTHKVVLGIPSPCTDFTEFGRIKKNGKTINIDFRNRNSRFEAVKWFIDELVNRFEAQHYKNITLEGVYWIEESTSMTSWQKDRKSGKWSNKTGNKYNYVRDNKSYKKNDIVADVAHYLHSTKGLMFYWIPFNGALGSDNWKSFGFDRCDTQTGYFWGTPDHLRNPQNLKTMTDLSRICDAAMANEKGLEFEVSSELFVPCYAKQKDKSDKERPFEIVRVKDCKKRPDEMFARGYKYLNYNPCLLARMENLIDVFESIGVFKRANISYYFDTSTILNLCNAREREIVKLVDRLARHISQRIINRY